MSTKTTLRRYAAPACATVAAAGIILAGVPASAAPVSISFNAQCRAAAIITVDKAAVHTFSVDAPKQVNPGKTFTYRIQPAGSAFPDKDSGATTTNMSRLKMDYLIPDNVTFVSAAVVPGTSTHLDGVPANVLRVNAAGEVDPAGTILRLSGNNEVIGNSPTSDTKSVGGIFAPKTKNYLNGKPSANGDSWFQLPAVDVTVTAGASGVITPKLRAAGTDADLGNDSNYNTFLALAVYGGDQWAPTRCVPKDRADNAAPVNRGGGPLATIAIGQQTGTVTTTALTVPAAADPGAAVELSATVAPAPNGGTVQFLVNGTAVGDPVATTGGKATLSHTFADAGTFKVSATYSGSATHVASSSDESTITVGNGGGGTGSFGSLQLPFGS